VSRLAINVHGETHPGKVRDANEDCFLVDTAIGLYGVFDGVGGHHAGDVASALARDTVHELVRKGVERGQPDAELVTTALQSASAAVHAEAKRRRDRRGMGTTAVLCLFVGDDRVVLAHVGDSRAYLLRERMLQQLTSDHTVIAELLAKNAITPDEALHHPYRNVLSRNLGGQAETRPAVQELTLAPGDRVLLCSDGLSSFASSDAIRQVLSGAARAETAAKDLVELALRGGGGDNVTTLVVEAGKARVPRRTHLVRTAGAAEWWRRRDMFLAEARARGVERSPVCAVLTAEEAIEIVAGNLCEAIYRDLGNTTGVHVWTYAENLAAGWFDQDGDYGVVRDLLDALRGAAETVVADIWSSDAKCGDVVDVAITRALVVAELAVGGVLARRLRAVESDMAALSARQTWPEVFTEQPTVPMLVPQPDPPSPAVGACLSRALETAIRLVRASESGEASVAVECVHRAHKAALEHGGTLDGAMTGRELFGGVGFGDPGSGPLLDALDRARRAHVQAVREGSGAVDVKGAALWRVATAHRLLCTGIARLLVEAGRPITDRLRETAEITAALRRKVGENEQHIAGFERRTEHTQPGWAPPREGA
jgi:protein phosphatase